MKFLHRHPYILVTLIFLIVSLSTTQDYVSTFDEASNRAIGNYYINNWDNFNNLDFEKTFSKVDQNIPPFTFTLMGLIKEKLIKYTKITNEDHAYHTTILFFSTLIILLLGYITKKIFGNTASLLATINLSISPRFIAHSQSNTKDIPIMFFISITLFFFYLCIKKEKTGVKIPITSGILLGLSYCTKITSVCIPVILIFWLAINLKRVKFTKEKVFSICYSIPSFFITVYILWPFYRIKVFTKFYETILSYKDLNWGHQILYYGKLIHGAEAPWHYPISLISISTPLIIYFSALSSIFIYYKVKENISKKLFLSLLWVWIIFSLVIQPISGAPMYDGVRHYLHCLFPLSILSSYTIEKVLKYFKFSKTILCIIALNYSYLIFQNYNFHPHQIAYFNTLSNGLKGAKNNFDIDYWGYCYKDIAKWLNENSTPENNRVYVPFSIHTFSRIKNDKIKFAHSSAHPNYKVTVSRGLIEEFDLLHNKESEIIYSTKINNVSICDIHKYKENFVLNSGELIQSNSSNTKNELSISVKNFDKTALGNNKFNFTSSNKVMENFTIKYKGDFKIPEKAKYCFELYSDDLSVLRLNSKKILISPTLKKSNTVVQLEKGYYNFELTFKNSGGPALLDAKWSKDNCDNLEQINIKNFYQK